MNKDSDVPVYATAVPISSTSFDNGKFSRRDLLQRHGSSYRLPSTNSSKDIQKSAVKQLEGQGFTKGMHWILLCMRNVFS